MGSSPVAGVAPSSDSHSGLPIVAASCRARAVIRHRNPVVGSPQVSCTPRTLTARAKAGSLTMSSATVRQTISGEYPRGRPNPRQYCGVWSAATISVPVNPAASSAWRRLTNQSRSTAVPW